MRNAILGLSALVLGACGATSVMPVQPPHFVEAPSYTCFPIDVMQQETRLDLSLPRDGFAETVVDHCANASGEWYRLSIDGTDSTAWGYQLSPIDGSGRRLLVDSNCSDDELRFEGVERLAIPPCWEEIGAYMRALEMHKSIHAHMAESND